MVDCARFSSSEGCSPVAYSVIRQTRRPSLWIDPLIEPGSAYFDVDRVPGASWFSRCGRVSGGFAPGEPQESQCVSDDGTSVAGVFCGDADTGALTGPDRASCHSTNAVANADIAAVEPVS